MDTLLQLLQNKELFVKYYPLLNRDLFPETNEKVLFMIVQEFYDTYRLVPTLSEINHLSDIEIKKPTNLWNEQFLDDEAKHFVENNTMRLAMEDSIEMLETNNYSGIVKKMQDATSIDFGESLGTSVYDIKDIFDILTSSKKLLPTGWATLDDMLGGGVQIPSLNYFVAKSGFGKSISLINLAYNIVKQGRDVLYISLELSDTEVLNRYFHHMAQTATKDFKLSDLLKKLEKGVLRGDGEMVAMFKQPGSLNSLELENIVEKFIATHDGRVPIIMMDYGGLMRPNEFYPQMASFEKDKAISEELRGVATKFDTVVWNVEQFNRQGVGDTEDVSEENIQGGLSKVQTCDNMFAMIPNGKATELGIINCKVLKARNAPCAGKYFSWLVDWSTITFKDNPKSQYTPPETSKGLEKIERTTKGKSNNPAANAGRKKVTGNMLRNKSI